MESSRPKQRVEAYARKLWHGWTAAFVAVPLALGAIEYFAEDEHLRFLLFPSVGAIIGTLGVNTFAPGFVGVALVSAITMVVVRLLGVTVPSVIALAILPLVFSPELVTLWYPPAVLLATVMLFLIFLGWRRTLPSNEQEGTITLLRRITPSSTTTCPYSSECQEDGFSEDVRYRSLQRWSKGCDRLRSVASYS